MQRIGLAALALMAVLWVPRTALALNLDLPVNAVETGTDQRASDQVLVPVGPRISQGGDGLVATGRIDRRAWEITESSATPFQILAPLVAQLEVLGFDIPYTCRDRDCGGFDFRLSLDLLPAPSMYVDLGDFRYLAATRDGPGGAEVVMLVASRSDGRGHLHLTWINPVADAGALETTAVTTIAAPTQNAATPTNLAASLDNTGRAVLDDLIFLPGSSELGAGPFASLQALANWMTANPNAAVVLVGHSDNVGGLDENIRLSERRAATVAGVLASTLGIERARVSARGVGYLSPRASNATDEGRQLNRRVEVVIAAP